MGCKRWNKIKSAIKGIGQDKSKSAAQALENPYILSKIFGYLDISSLKAVRFVSSLWEEESCPFLKAATTSAFRISDYSDPHQSTIWSRYLRDMADFGDHPNWKITVHKIECRREFNELYLDFLKLLSSPQLHSNVKRVKLFLHWDTSGSLLFQLLSSKLSATIEELKLTMIFVPCSTLPALRLPKVAKPLKSLKYLKLKFTNRDMLFYEFPKDEVLKSCAKHLLPFCRNVQKISLVSQKSYVNLWILREIVAARDSQGFPNLKEIKATTVEVEGITLLKRIREETVGKLEINENSWRVEESCACYTSDWMCEEHSENLEAGMN